MGDGDNLKIGERNEGNDSTILLRTGDESSLALEVFSEGPRARAVSASASGDGSVGLVGEGPGEINSAGVFGQTRSGPGVIGLSRSGEGLKGISITGFGVQGMCLGANPGVIGVASGNPDSNGVVGLGEERGNGVAGFANSGNAVFGQSDAGFAGFFEGNVRVTGVLEKPGGGFKIDHPLDPTNMYLNHCFVESSEMKSVYDGVALLDATGAAWVELPEWFEALNRDFRYQLTAVGAPAPELHIAEEISDNRFKVAGGEEGVKVCWQLTGIRKDRWAEANPIEVEEEKHEDDQGRYLHPQPYGEPEESGIDRARQEEQVRRIRQQLERQTPAPGIDDLASLEEQSWQMEEGQEEEEPPEGGM